MFGINRGGWNSCSPPRAFLKVMVNFFYSSALTLCSSEHLEGRWCGMTLAARWSACLFDEMPLFVDVEERRRRARCYTHANGWQASIRFSAWRHLGSTMGNWGRFGWGDGLGGERPAKHPCSRRPLTDCLCTNRAVVHHKTSCPQCWHSDQTAQRIREQTRKVGLLFLWWASTLQPPGNYHVYVYYYWSCIQIMCTLSNPMCLQSIYVFLDCCDQKMPRHDERRNLMAKHCPVWLMEKSMISEIVPLLLKEDVIPLFLTFVPGFCRVTQVC